MIWYQLVSFQDIAIYGCLCALATFSRADLKLHVIDNAQFKQFLEVTPVVQTIVSDFYKSKYSSCFSNLERLAAELKLDLNIHSHTVRLLSAIRHKAILQYFSPFASVSLGNMARAFNTDVASIEKEVASIIAAGQLAAKIDSHSKVRTAAAARAQPYARNSNNVLISLSLSLSLSLSTTNQTNTNTNTHADLVREPDATAPANLPECVAPRRGVREQRRCADTTRQPPESRVHRAPASKQDASRRNDGPGTALPSRDVVLGHGHADGHLTSSPTHTLSLSHSRTLWYSFQPANPNQTRYW